MRAERAFTGNPAEETNEHQLDHVFRLVLPGTETGVRRGLGMAKCSLEKTRYSTDEIASVELVLAEILNNVVEHAYAGQQAGEIELNLFVTNAGLFCSVLDDGCAMPGGEPPTGHRVEIGTQTADLPEGGFGWFLIRELAEDLEYCRIGDQNRLDFRMNIGLGPAPNAS